MSRKSDEEGERFDSGLGLGRRTFLQASGAAVGAGLLGAGAETAAAGHEDDGGFQTEYANWRVIEASKVWDRGFRGRQDRPMALTDSGLDALHPDLGPWNDIRVEDTAQSFQLVEDTFERIEGSGLDTTRTLPPGSGTRAAVADIPVPARADRVRVGAVDAGLEQNGVVSIEAADGDELDSNDGLLADYLGVAAPVAREETKTVTVAVTSTTATPDTGSPDGSGTEVDFRVRFYENTAGRGATETTTLKPIEGEQGTQTESGTIGPSVTGPAQQSIRIDLKQPPNAAEVQANLSFSPPGGSGPVVQDLDFYLVEKSSGKQVASSGSLPGSAESFTAAIGGDTAYQMRIDGYAVAQAEYEVTAGFAKAVAQRNEPSGPNRARKVVESLDAATDADDKTLAWYGTPRYGEFAKARDGNGHGTHVASTMGGSGRASTVERATEQRPETVLLPGDSISYEVSAAAGTGVFATAYGDGLDLVIEDPEGQTIAQSQLVGGGPHSFDSSVQDSAIAVAPTTHGPHDPDGEGPRATYTVHLSASQENNTGTPLVTRLDRIQYGSFADPDDVDGDESGGAPDTVQAGVAPNAGLVGIQGLSDGLAALAKDPEWWAETFGLRSVNMSWGNVGGIPFGAFGGAFSGSPAQLKAMAAGGLLTVAAAGNSYTPANGNSEPAVADEVVSVAATGPLDGLTSFSSGGAAALDEDSDRNYTKPDATAPGGRAPAYPASIGFPPVYDDIVAAKNGIPEDGGERRSYTGKIGTSMASPYANGVASLLANAMEFGTDDSDSRPGALTLPRPAETGLEDVLRWKSVLLATASETCFTAAPYHEAKTIPHAPTYEHGGRDPYEGYGRVNPDAAVDAVTREFEPGRTLSAEVGLDLPQDSRAVAGYIDAENGTYTVDLSFSGFSGGNKGMTKGAPHLDLFVYDPAAAAATESSGEPSIVASAQGRQGDASVSFSAEGDTDEGYIVVAKLVNVPGVVNGFDVQAGFDLSVSLDRTMVESVTRTDDGTVYTAGDTNHVEIDLTAADEPLYIRDTLPSGWTVTGGDFDHDHENDDGTTTVVFTAHGEGGTESLDAHYFARSPNGPQGSGSHTFGPVEVSTDGDGWVAVAGTTDTNRVVGVDG